MLSCTALAKVGVSGVVSVKMASVQTSVAVATSLLVYPDFVAYTLILYVAEREILSL
jgi:hypothetical protein